jgi:hypothetical protein
MHLVGQQEGVRGHGALRRDNMPRDSGEHARRWGCPAQDDERRQDRRPYKAARAFQ